MSNKSNSTVSALIVGLLLCAVLYALLVAPKTFNWDLPPQNRNTDQPFAQTVMHDVLSHSFQHGYRVSDNLAQTLRQQKKDTCENLIVCFDDYTRPKKTISSNSTAWRDWPKAAGASSTTLIRQQEPITAFSA